MCFFEHDIMCSPEISVPDNSTPRRFSERLILATIISILINHGFYVNCDLLFWNRCTKVYVAGIYRGVKIVGKL